MSSPSDQLIIKIDGKQIKVTIDKTTDGREILGTQQKNLLVGTCGSDTLQVKDLKSKGKDISVGGPGNDHSALGEGDDVYVWGKGHGNDTYVEYRTGNARDDIVLILGDVKPSDLDYWMGNNEKGERNLYIKIKDTEEFVTIPREANEEAIARIEFNDSGETPIDVRSNIEYRGKPKGDILKGSGSRIIFKPDDDGFTEIFGCWDSAKKAECRHKNDSIFVIGKGKTIIHGPVGNNGYIWSGEGKHTIIENKAPNYHYDVLTVKPDVDPVNIEYYINKNNDLIIKNNITKGIVKIPRAHNEEAMSKLIYEATGEEIDLVDNYFTHNYDVKDEL